MSCAAEHCLGASDDHVVQFYGDDDDLADAVGPYLAGALEVGGVAFVIVSEAHRRLFAARLAARGVDVAAVEAAGRLVVLDAAEAADKLMVDGRIDPGQFHEVVATPFREAAAGGRPVAAYGEIVALLWAAGHVSAALELEALWNELGREVPFSLYCAYPAGTMEAGGVGAFQDVCEEHSAVIGPPLRLSRVEPAEYELARRFEWSGRGPAGARRFVTETLISWGHEGLVDDAAVVVTELASNAVLHARTEFTVVVSRRADGTVRVAVRDDSAVPPRPRLAGPYDGSGRGLRLVEAIAGGWTADLLPSGKVVWAELRPTG